jgi:hypothetical protein
LPAFLLLLLLLLLRVCVTEVMCEGLDHPDAGPLDRWHAAQQLQAATQHTLDLEAAKPRGWDAEEQLYSK